MAADKNSENSGPLSDLAEIRLELEQLTNAFDAIRIEVHRVVAGQENVVRAVLSAMFLNGHVLLEGLPGLGKTVLVRTLAETAGLGFARIQFTPDLMPADIIGTRLLATGENGQVQYTFEKGPVFTNLLLADEINRATPKTQSAMLEAMQEHQVTIAGVSHPLPEPFVVLATQNPLELEGTYPLPEAQLDRFLFKVNVEYPDLLTLVEIMKRTTGHADSDASRPVAALSGEKFRLWRKLVRQVPVATAVLEYGSRILLATQPGNGSAVAEKFLRFGASPRALQAMVMAGKLRAVLEGRASVGRDDLKAVATECLQHRIILNFEAESQGVRADGVIEQLLRQVK